MQGLQHYDVTGSRTRPSPYTLDASYLSRYEVEGDKIMSRIRTARLAIAAGLVTATFAAAIAPATASAAYGGYSDVSQSSWVVQEGVIDWAETNGAVDGNSDGTWGVTTIIDRGTAAEILYKLAGRPKVSGSTNFADSDTFGWADKAIVWAQRAGIFSGNIHTDGSVTFDPWEPLTREQAAKVLRVVARSRSVNPDAIRGFQDKSTVSGWAAGSVAWAVENEIMGKSGYLAGGSNCTKAEFVSMLMSTDRRVDFDDDYFEDRFDDPDDYWDDDDDWDDLWDDDRWDDDDDEDWDDQWDDDDRWDDDDDDWDDDDRWDDDDDDDWDDDDRWDDDDDDDWDD